MSAKRNSIPVPVAVNQVIYVSDNQAEKGGNVVSIISPVVFEDSDIMLEKSNASTVEKYQPKDIDQAKIIEISL